MAVEYKFNTLYFATLKLNVVHVIRRYGVYLWEGKITDLLVNDVHLQKNHKKNHEKNKKITWFFYLAHFFEVICPSYLCTCNIGYCRLWNTNARQFLFYSGDNSISIIPVLDQSRLSKFSNQKRNIQSEKERQFLKTKQQVSQSRTQNIAS